MDLRRIFKYSGECFLEAMPLNLVRGTNAIAEYTGFEPLILSFQGFSFARKDGMKFYANVDGVPEYVKISDLGAAKGLDHEELMKFPSVRAAKMFIYTPEDVLAFQMRYKVAVFKPTTALKVALGLSLTNEDKRLDAKYGISSLMKEKVPQPFDLYYGIEEWRTEAVRMMAGGTVLRVPVPMGKKVILTGISAARPTESAKGYVIVNRDGVDEVLKLDLYCLASLPYDIPIRIIALDTLEVLFDMRVSDTYYIRVTYGIGRLTISEKILWGLDLTGEESKIAEERNLYERVKAGVI